MDDEPVLLEICKLFLEKTGEFQVQTESSAGNALNRLRQESFDVIVSDYQMPEIDGIEFLKQIRSHGNPVPFIIFTGRGREEIAIAALKEGADFYLQKGGDPRSQFAELMNQIRQVVRQRHAEMRVRENEQKYHALFDSALDAFFIIDNGVIVECNRQMEYYFQRSRQALIGMHPAELSPAYQPDGTLSSVAAEERIALALAGTPVIFEWKHTRRDGSEFDAEVSLNRFEIAGRFVLIAVLRDITARKENEIELYRKSEELSASYEELMSTEEELRTQYRITTQSEEALQESQAYLEAIIQGSPIPQFVIDKNHLVTHWNRALAQYCRIDAMDILGTDNHWKAFYSEKRPCLADLLLNKEFDRITEWYGPKVSRSQLIPDAYNGVDYFPGMGEGGTWLSFTASIIRDQQGNIIGALETLEDITTQKKASLDLEESESRYRGVIENLQDSFYRSDMEGRLIMASPSILPLLGYQSFHECIGKKIAETFYANPKDREVLRSAIARDGSVTNYEVTLKKKDGTPILVSTSSHLYYDRDGKPAGIEGTFRDITKLVENSRRLKRNEAILTAVVQESPVPLFVIDTNHQVMHWNKALETYSGIPAQKVLGTSGQWQAFYTTERPCMADLLLDDEISSLSEWYPGKYAPSHLIDGAYEAVDFFPDLGDDGCWLFFTAAPIRDANGGLIGAVEILQDISERVRAENALQGSENSLQAIITGSPIPQFVIDKDHRVIQWNHALAAYSRIPAEDIIGTDHHWRAFYPEKYPCLADLIVDGIDITKGSFRENYQPSSLIAGGFEATDFFPTMGGEGAWLFFTAAPIRNDQGLIVGAVETLEDITERKRADNALMESEERFRTLFSNATDAIFLHQITPENHPGTFIEVNNTACLILGFTREELIRMSPLDIDTDNSPDREQIYSGFQKDSGHITYETILRSKSNESIPVEINAHVYEFKGERVVLSIARDISERKRFESALQNANKKLNLLSSITRHDILNQLTALTGYLALSEDSTKDEGLLLFIRKEKKIADTIFHQILFTRDYQNVGIQSPRWQNLKMLIGQAASLLDTGEIRLDIDVPSVAVYADPLLEKVFFNLVDNSVRYGRDITYISFSIKENDGKMRLIYCDDGGGIPPDEKENIFNLKYYNNTGFGLFLSREILAITGYSISETGEYGKGVRFEIEFPEGSYHRDPKMFLDVESEEREFD